MYTIRTADDSDAAALAALMAQTYRATFSASNTAEDMALHCRRHYGEAIQLAEIRAADVETFISTHADELTGYVQLRWPPPPACVGVVFAVEINRLYVAAHWHGQGVAHALMAESIRRALHRGARRIWLGVWEHNARAQAFYRKHGFVTVGEHTFLMGADPQRDLLLVRDINAADAIPTPP